MPSTLTAYEISIVPLIAFNTEFSCRAFYKGNQDPTVTNKIPIVVLHPRPTFTGDNIVGSTNHPFNVTCSTAHFKELYGKIYTVKFYSLLDGQLARYEVDGKITSFFNRNIN